MIVTPSSYPVSWDTTKVVDVTPSKTAKMLCTMMLKAYAVIHSNTTRLKISGVLVLRKAPHTPTRGRGVNSRFWETIVPIH